MKKSPVLITILIIVLAAAGLKAEISSDGAPFLINGYEQQLQNQVLSTSPDGRTIIAWESLDTIDRSYDIRARVYNPASRSMGTEFVASSYTYGSQTDPLIAVAVDGSFVVAWKGEGADGYGNYFRSFNSEGVPRSGDIFISSSKLPFDITMTDSRTVVAAYASSSSVIVQKYSPDGLTMQNADSFNAVTGKIFLKGSADGSFVIMYYRGTGGKKGTVIKKGTVSGSEIYAKHFGSSGIISPEILITSNVLEQNAGVAINSDGAFIVSWAGIDGFYASVFGPGGEVISSETLIHAYPATISGIPDTMNMAMNQEGHFILSWKQLNSDKTQSLYGALFEFDTALLEDSFQIHSASLIYGIAAGISDSSIFMSRHSSAKQEYIYGEIFKSDKMQEIREPKELIPVVEKMYEDGLIKKRSVKKRIIHKLQKAQKKLDRGKTRWVRRKLHKLIRYIERKKRKNGKYINLKAADLLIEKLHIIISEI